LRRDPTREIPGSQKESGRESKHLLCKERLSSEKGGERKCEVSIHSGVLDFRSALTSCSHTRDRKEGRKTREPILILSKS